MNPLVAIAVALGLVVATTALGLLLKARAGRVATVDAGSAAAGIVTAEQLPSATPLGSRATLLQFSTEFCAPCRATHGLLERTAAARQGVTHLDIDLTHRPDLSRRFGILQTPTTFVLDGAGAIRARIGGAPRQAELVSALDELIADHTIIGGAHADSHS